MQNYHPHQNLHPENLFHTGCARNHFALIDVETGKEVGRYAYRTGEKVRLDGREYQIRQLGSHESAVEQYLKMTIIPEVEICYANVHDTVDFVADCVRVYAPTNMIWTTPRPEIRLDLSQHPQAEIPLITIRGVQDISAFACLQRVCQQGGLRLVINQHYVSLEPKKGIAQQPPAGDHLKAPPEE